MSPSYTYPLESTPKGTSREQLAEVVERIHREHPEVPEDAKVVIDNRDWQHSTITVSWGDYSEPRLEERSAIDE